MQALSQLRLVGVNGPYSVVLGANEYTELTEARDYEYPVLEHVKRTVDWRPISVPQISVADRGEHPSSQRLFQRRYFGGAGRDRTDT